MSDSTRILIADDQQLVREGLRVLLDLMPEMEVVGEAANGAEAVERTQILHPDIVLMDVQMPELDGFEFLKIKNLDPNLRDIPTIVISARDPLGHPIVSKTLSVTCSDGLSVRTLLECIKALTAILAGSSAGSAFTL